MVNLEELLDSTPCIYAGIGARKTPRPILILMWEFAKLTARRGIRLRSGGALGADTAFADGYHDFRSYGITEIYTKDDVDEASLSLAKSYHPKWHKVSPIGRKLHARNGKIILGENLDDPVDFIVCWTIDGKASGGTGQALRIAEDPIYNIPIFNLFHQDVRDEMTRIVRNGR